MFKKLENIFREDTYFKVFFISLLITGLGYGIYKGMIDNYLAEIVSMSEFDRGVTEFFREIPGLLLVFILAIFYKYSAETIYKAGAIVMLIGLGILMIVPPAKILVILSMFIFSLGEHLQLGMKNSITLQYSKPEKVGEALGQQSAVYQVGTLAGYLIIVVIFTFLTLTDKMFKPFFLISTVFSAIGAFFAFKTKGKSTQSKVSNRFYFKRKYSKYYMLEVFYGARKQVFFTFGPYVLILSYGANAQIISLLFAISAICCFIFAPIIGKLIDKVGYKIIMISDTLILVIVCFFYGFSHHIFPRNIAFIVCCINYILDSIISLASMASNVYVQDISDNPEEVRATISTGVSVNHLITVLIALFGGWIWQTLGIETLFCVSAALGICNSIYAATIKTGNNIKKSPAN